MRNKKLVLILGLIFVSALVILIILTAFRKENFSKSDSAVPAENAEISKDAIDADTDDFSCRDCNLVIISLTNVSASHLGSYGYFRKDISPHIDAFNEKAIVFKNAFTVSSWTPPAAASLFTSLYPYAHNLMRWYTDVKPLDKNIPTLASILKKNGFATASFNGGADYDTAYGLNNGFDTYHQGEAFTGLKDATPFAIKWLEENKDKKFFLHLQGFDVHCPYSPSEIKYGFDYENKNNINFSRCFYNATEQDPQIIKNEKFYSAFSSLPPRIKRAPNEVPSSFSDVLLSEEDIQHLNDLYDSDINYADKLLGDFLTEFDTMGLYGNTMVVFVSEHGEMIFKNGRIMRGGIMRGNFYEDVAHIPFSIRIPSAIKKNYEELISIVDVAPTILDILKIDRSDYFFQGKSLMSLLKDGEEVNDYVFGGTEFYGNDYNKSGSKFFFGSIKSDLRMVRSKEWKLIEEDVWENEKKIKKYELYDVENDSEETANVSGKGLEIERILKDKLGEWAESVSVDKNETLNHINEDLFEEMKARGY